MQDNYYNHMISTLLPNLKQMLTLNEPGTMDQYKTMPIKEWDKLTVMIDSLKDYTLSNGKKNQLMNFYSDKVYPVLISGRQIKQGFKKLYAIRVDDFDFRQLISKCESLIM